MTTENIQVIHTDTTIVQPAPDLQNLFVVKHLPSGRYVNGYNSRTPKLYKLGWARAVANMRNRRANWRNPQAPQPVVEYEVMPVTIVVHDQPGLF